MNDDVKALWVEALKSNKYQQCTGYLHVRTLDGDKFCCLGVLCDLAVSANVLEGPRPSSVPQREPAMEYGECGSIALLPPEVQQWAGLTETPTVDGGELTILNDNYHASFNTIADRIESGQSWE